MLLFGHFTRHLPDSLHTAVDNRNVSAMYLQFRVKENDLEIN